MHACAAIMSHRQTPPLLLTAHLDLVDNHGPVGCGRGRQGAARERVQVETAGGKQLPTGVCGLTQKARPHRTPPLLRSAATPPTKFNDGLGHGEGERAQARAIPAAAAEGGSTTSGGGGGGQPQQPASRALLRAVQHRPVHETMRGLSPAHARKGGEGQRQPTPTRPLAPAPLGPASSCLPW